MLPGPSRLAFQSRPNGATRRQSSSTAGSSRPSTLVMPLGAARAAACMAWPRWRTTFRPDSKSIAPAKTRAVYSPRLSPAAPWQAATTSGLAGLEALERRQAGDEDRRLADVGRLERVGRPLEAERPQVDPRISPARSNRARTAGSSWSSSRPMPTSCAPWPGNKKAILGMDRHSLA